jgi:hypothetical protein
MKSLYTIFFVDGKEMKNSAEAQHRKINEKWKKYPQWIYKILKPFLIKVQLYISKNIAESKKEFPLNALLIFGKESERESVIFFPLHMVFIQANHFSLFFWKKKKNLNGIGDNTKSSFNGGLNTIPCHIN